MQESNDNREYYLTLILSGLSLGKQKHLVSMFKSLADANYFERYTSDLASILTGDEYQTIREIITTGAVDRHLKGLDKNGIGLITIENIHYPDYLKNIHDPPFVLYYRGDITLLKTDCIAIVGTRVCTRYGIEQTGRFAKELCKAGFTIVSGLAEGIDTYAHKGALEAGGKTIAVLAGGLNTIYPAINVNLAHEISEKGLLISENVPQFLPKGYAFVQRNRIIAGISLGVFVPEMGAKSGAMHTLNFANEEGRMIFVLPGNVTSSSSVGTNNLIKNLQGACVTESNDIIKNYPEHSIVDNQKIARKHQQLDLYEKLICDILKVEELHFDEILQKTKMEPKKLVSLLTTMEIRGLIKKLAGNYYST